MTEEKGREGTLLFYGTGKENRKKTWRGGIRKGGIISNRIIASAGDEEEKDGEATLSWAETRDEHLEIGN